MPACCKFIEFIEAAGIAALFLFCFAKVVILRDIKECLFPKSLLAA